MNTPARGSLGSSVLVVDDNPDNLRLLAKVLRRGGLVPRPVLSGRIALEAAQADPPDLVLLDIRMPEMSGFEVCRRFKEDPRLEGIPVVFISGLHETADKLEAFDAGGVDFVSKPVQETEVLARVHTHLRLKRLQVQLARHNDELARRVEVQVRATTAAQLATIFALAKLAEARDDDTGRHVERVQTLSRVLGEQMRDSPTRPEPLTQAFIDTLFMTASLHDIGKVAVPDAILMKRGRLTEAEFEVMKLHTVNGATTLASVLERFPDNAFLEMAVDVARSHHERWDGGGYPDGLRGTAIPLSARIVAVADVYDALSNDRCYRDALEHDVVRDMITAGAGTQFDPEVCAAFAAVEGRFRAIGEEMSAPPTS